MSHTSPDELFRDFFAGDGPEMDSSAPQSRGTAELVARENPARSSEQTTTNVSSEEHPSVGNKRPARFGEGFLNGVKKIVLGLTSTDGATGGENKYQAFLSNLRQASRRTEEPRDIFSVSATAVKDAMQRTAADVVPGRPELQDHAESEASASSSQRSNAGGNVQIRQQGPNSWIIRVLDEWKNAVKSGIIDIRDFHIPLCNEKVAAKGLPYKQEPEILQSNNRVYLCYNGSNSYFIDAAYFEEKLVEKVSLESWDENTSNTVLYFGFLAVKEYQNDGIEVLPEALRARFAICEGERALGYTDFRTRKFKGDCYGKKLRKKFSEIKQHLLDHEIDLDQVRPTHKIKQHLLDHAIDSDQVRPTYMHSESALNLDPFFYFAPKCVEQCDSMIVHSPRALVDGFNLRMMYANCEQLQEFFCVPDVDRTSYTIRKKKKHWLLIAKLAMAAFVSRNCTVDAYFFHFKYVAQKVIGLFERFAATSHDDVDRRALCVAIGLTAVASSCVKQDKVPEHHKMFSKKGEDYGAIANFQNIGKEIICNSDSNDPLDPNFRHLYKSPKNLEKIGTANFVVNAVVRHVVYRRGISSTRAVANERNVHGNGWIQQFDTFRRKVDVPVEFPSDRGVNANCPNYHYDAQRILCCSALAPSAFKLAEYATDPALLMDLRPPGGTTDWAYQP